MTSEGLRLFRPRRVVRGPGEPMISIGSGARVYMDSVATDLLGNPPEVEILYDPDRTLLGIRGAAAGSPDGYRLDQSGTGGVRFVMKGLARYYGLKIDARRYFIGELRDGTLLFDLSKPIERARGDVS